MSQTITKGITLGSDSTGKIMNVGLWILQIGAAGNVPDGRLLKALRRSADGRAV